MIIDIAVGDHIVVPDIQSVNFQDNPSLTSTRTVQFGPGNTTESLTIKQSQKQEVTGDGSAEKANVTTLSTSEDHFSADVTFEDGPLGSGTETQSIKLDTTTSEQHDIQGTETRSGNTTTPSFTEVTTSSNK